MGTYNVATDASGFSVECDTRDVEQSRMRLRTQCTRVGGVKLDDMRTAYRSHIIDVVHINTRLHSYAFDHSKIIARSWLIFAHVQVVGT